jgi:putative copper export protein
MIEILGLVARWARFVAMLTIVGAVVFRLVVLRRSMVGAVTVAAATRRVAILGAAASTVMVISALVWVTLQTADMRFPDEAWLEVGTRLVGQTSWGTVWMIHIAAAALLIAAFAAARQGALNRWIVPAILSVVLAVTLTTSSHAMSAKRFSNISVVTDLLHVLGASAWLGTLGVMFTSIASGDGAVEGGGDGRYVSELLRTFSPIALTCAGLVVCSGVVSSLAHIQTVNGLFESRYGLTLLAKIATVLLIAFFGWRNWKRITPGVIAVGSGPMRRGMAAELLTTAIVLLITSALVVTAPPT